MNYSRERVNEDQLQQILKVQVPRLRRYLAMRIPTELQHVISVEDVLQNVCVAAIRGLPGFLPRVEDSVDRWLTCVAQRVMINAIKTARRADQRGRYKRVWQDPEGATSLADLFALVASPGRTPSSEAAMAEAVDAVQIALATLPPARRRAIWMRFIEGQSPEAIAKALKRTPGAVNGLLFHGLRQLQKRLGSASKFLSDAPSSPAASNHE